MKCRARYGICIFQCRECTTDQVGWQTYNAHYWKTRYPEFVAFFVRRIFTEPHSTKQVEDATGWALETDGETLAAADRGIERCDAAATRQLAAQVDCPVLVMPGTQDMVRDGLENFVAKTGVDELMITGMIYDHEARLHSFDLAAQACAELSAPVEA